MTWVVSPTLSKAQRKTEFLGNAKSLADVKPKAGPPLDYSFKEISSISEILSEEPNSGFPKAGPETSQAGRPRTDLNSTSLKVSNNSIGTLAGLPEALAEVMDDPSELTWLDLSFNKLTSIEEIIMQFPMLKVLYLHANEITNIREVKKLARLPELSKLTLHGNDLEGKNQSTYRLTVMAYLPNLKSLDFIAITKVNRQDAQTLSDTMKRRRG